MKTGTFYSVGVGPGDPELMTYKAVRIIQDSGIVVVPKSGASENIALKIAGERVRDKEIIECDMPMTKDGAKQEEYHQRAALQIAAYLDAGKDVAFLTLGDPSIYSTAMYVHERLKRKGYKTEMVPGVPSFCAAAASLDVALCEGGQLLHIVPATYRFPEDVFALEGNKVLMKSGKKLPQFIEGYLAGVHCGEYDAMMVERASMEGERIYSSLQEVDGESSYFSIIVLKKVKEVGL